MMIPVYQPDLTGNESKYVNECLQTSWISSKGKFVNEFEKSFASAIGVSCAATVSNGTVALHLALLVLGIEAGDEVIVPSFTYIASVNAIKYIGAVPVFVDIEPESWQLDCSAVEALLTDKTKAIMAVHMYGHPADMLRLKQLADKHDLFLIEDCAEAFGTFCNGIHVGNFGDISTFSFFGNKTITTGEGGMVVTNDPVLDDKVRHFKGQGLMAGKEYWHDVVGYNYRMTNICAAIGLAQLEKAQQFLQRKRSVAEFYMQSFKNLPLLTQQIQPGMEHSWWMFSVLAENAQQRDALRQHLGAANIETRPLFNPVHLMPMYKSGLVLPVTENIAPRGMNLPSWPGLTDKMLEHIAVTIRNFF